MKTADGRNICPGCSAPEIQVPNGTLGGEYFDDATYYICGAWTLDNDFKQSVACAYFANVLNRLNRALSKALKE